MAHTALAWVEQKVIHELAPFENVQQNSIVASELPEEILENLTRDADRELNRILVQNQQIQAEKWERGGTPPGMESTKTFMAEDPGVSLRPLNGTLGGNPTPYNTLAPSGPPGNSPFGATNSGFDRARSTGVDYYNHPPVPARIPSAGRRSTSGAYQDSSFSRSHAKPAQIEISANSHFESQRETSPLGSFVQEHQQRSLSRMSSKSKMSRSPTHTHSRPASNLSNYNDRADSRSVRFAGVEEDSVGQHSSSFRPKSGSMRARTGAAVMGSSSGPGHQEEEGKADTSLDVHARGHPGFGNHLLSQGYEAARSALCVQTF